MAKRNQREKLLNNNDIIFSTVTSIISSHVYPSFVGNVGKLEGSKKNELIRLDTITGHTLVNRAVDGEELILNDKIDLQGVDDVEIEGTVEGGKIDVVVEGNTLVNVSKTKDEVLLSHEYESFVGNEGKLQDSVVDETIKLDTITGHTLVNRAVDGEELILNDKIDITGENEVVINDTVDGGKVDVVVEGNTLVNRVVSDKIIVLNDKIDVSGENEVVIDGTVDGGKVDVVVEGNTLVNILKTNTSAWGRNRYNGNDNLYNNVYKRYNSSSMNSNMIIPNTTYTLIITAMPKYATGKAILLTDIAGNYTGNFVNNKFVFTTSNFDNSTPISSFIPHLDYDKTVEYNAELPSNDTMFVLLEGDYTDKEIPDDYFEGTKSVGEVEDNKIKVLSRNKNLFDGYWERGTINSSTGELTDVSSEIRSVNFMEVKEGQVLTFSYPLTVNLAIRMYDKNKKFLGATELFNPAGTVYSGTTKTIPKNVCYMKFKLIATDLNLQLQVENGSKETSYVTHNENIISLQLQEPLRGLPNGVRDKIVHKNNKWYVERNCGKIILDSNFDTSKLDINGSVSTQVNTLVFAINRTRARLNYKELSKGGYCNNFPTYDVINNNDFPMVYFGQNINIRINRADLQTSDLNGIKQWINDNPIEIIYQLNIPTYEEITSPQLLTYLDKTYVSVDSTIPANLSVKNEGVDLIGVSNGDYTLVETIDGVRTSDTITLDSNTKYLPIYGDKGKTVKEIMLLDGENAISNGYFEGMKSVGEVEGSKIEVLSQNKNLFDGEYKKSYLQGGTETVYKNGTMLTNCAIIRVPKNTNIFVSKQQQSNRSMMALFYNYPQHNDEYTGITLNDETGTKINTGNNNFLVVYVSNENEKPQLLVEISDTKSEYVTHKENKKEISINKPLRGLPNGVRDKIVHRNNKWYVERNCKEYTFTGDEDWQHSLQALWGNDDIFSMYLKNYLDIECYCVLCDVFKSYHMVTEMSGCTDNYVATMVEGVEDRFLVLGIKKTLMSSINVGGGKDYLQSNPIKLIGQLITPVYEEITNPQLLTYLDKTYFNVSSTIPANIQVSNSGIELQGIAPNSTYTLAKDVVGTSTNAVTVDLAGQKQVVEDTITTGDIVDNYMKLYGKGITYKNVMLLDGVENNYSEYFKGLRSSFDTIDSNGKYPVKVKVHGKNLFDLNKLNLITNDNKNIGSLRGNELILKPTGLYQFGGMAKIELNTNKSYTIKFDKNINDYHRIELRFHTNNSYDMTKDGYLNIKICNDILTFKPTTSYCSLIISNGSSLNDCIISNIQLEEGTEATEYEPYYEDTKTIYLNSPLLQGDELVNREDGVYHVHNAYKDIITDKTSISDTASWGSSTGNTTEFRISLSKTGKGEVICNNFNTAKDNIWVLDVEGCKRYEDTTFDVRIQNIKLKSVDVEGFKQWLIDNPLSVVYKLYEPYEEKVSDEPLNLIATTNSFLQHDSIIPLSNTTTKAYIEELTYLQNNTKYVVCFEADKVGDMSIDLGGAKINYTTVKGYNKVEITTSTTTSNILKVDGRGVTISKVVVSTQEPNKYFEGMQSIGELENNNITIKSTNCPIEFGKGGRL